MMGWIGRVSVKIGNLVFEILSLYTTLLCGNSMNTQNLIVK